VTSWIAANARECCSIPQYGWRLTMLTNYNLTVELQLRCWWESDLC